MNYTVKFNNYGVSEILSDCISNNKELFFKQGKTLYFDAFDEPSTKEDVLNDNYISTSIEQILKKKPSKKWCIEEIKSHFRIYGQTMIDDCYTAEPFYSLAQELIEKHNL